MPAPGRGGGGGVGRSRLAVEYAHRHAGSYGLVWWVDAATPGRAEACLLDLAARVVPPATGAGPEVIGRLWGDLGQRDDWLLIYDDVHAPLELGIAAPPDSGRVIMIGAGAEIARVVPVLVPVGPLCRAEAVDLLRTYDARVTTAEAAGLAAALDDRPLALVLAGRFLARTGLSVAEYHALLAGDHPPPSPPSPPSGPEAVSPGLSLDAVVATSRAWLVARDPAAADLLDGLAVLAPAPLPLTSARARERVALAADELVAWGLVCRDGTDLSVHPLVRDGVRAVLPEGGWAPALLRAQRLLATVALGTVALDGAEAGGSSCLEALEPHVRAVTAWIERGCLAGQESAEFRRLTLGVVRGLHLAGRSGAGRVLGGQARRRWTPDLGPDHADLLDLADVEAEILADGLDDLPAARDLLTDAYTRRARRYGVRDRAALRAAAALARVHGELGDSAEAVRLFRETLSGQRDVLGPDDPETLATAHGLGDLLTRLGCFAEARDLLRATYAGRARVCGADDPGTHWTAAVLGAALRGLGEPGQARVLHERVLASARRRFGDGHPQTLYAAVHLAADLAELGAADLGRDLFTEVIGWDLFGWYGDDLPAGPRAAVARWARRHHDEIANLWTND